MRDDEDLVGKNAVDDIRFSDAKVLPRQAVISLYRSLGWSSAEKPDALLAALANSHAVVSAWDGSELVGLGNTLSDGHLVVNYPHLLVRPEYQGKGIGKRIVERLKANYDDIHMHILVSDEKAVAFFERAGFVKAGRTQSMWIYEGGEH